VSLGLKTFLIATLFVSAATASGVMAVYGALDVGLDTRYGRSRGGTSYVEVRVGIDVFAVEKALAAGVSVTLPFYGGLRTLNLEKVDIYAPGARMEVETEVGIKVYPLQSGSYRGTFLSESGKSGRAALTVHAPFLSAMLRSERLVEWIRTDYIDDFPVYYAGQRDASAGRSGAPAAELMEASASSVSSRSTYRESSNGNGLTGTLSHGTFNCYTAYRYPPIVSEDIVPHADYEYYVLKGKDSIRVRDDIEADINRLNDVYRPEACMEFRILGIPVHTSSRYEMLTSTDPSTLLGQFKDHFRSAHDPYYLFDIAHLFTGKELDGDVIGLADNLGGRYTLSQQIDPCPGCWLNPPYDAEDYDRLILESHEIGHSYNGNHGDAAIHACPWLQPCQYTIMWSPFEEVMMDDFSDENTNRIRAEAPKVNVELDPL
jgi:hypothetical protein